MDSSRFAERLILVTGATGNQGGAVARHLLHRGFRVRALTRDLDKPAARALTEQGAEVVQGDLDDRASLKRALEEAYGVFSVQNFFQAGYEGEIRQGITLADAAKSAGVRHFVYSSVGSADRKTGIPHFESKWQIEEHVRQIGLPHTVFRPVAFYYSITGPDNRKSVLDGTWAMPLSPDTRLQMLSEEDYAVFVAMALEHPDPWLGRTIDVASDELTMLQMAETFSRVIGRSVRYVQTPWNAFRQAAGEEFTTMVRWMEDVGYDANLAALRKEYSKLTTLEQYLRSHGWESVETSVVN
ncbi:NmrA/HSCARG family protein [Scytonema sp. PCC 10023]|uniref:NmrA/HSCARG family protein n=1 Tax=Scytonema sp. PCC 10023 TaxID=1680591 RepID=UPI0039C5B33D